MGGSSRCVEFRIKSLAVPDHVVPLRKRILYRIVSPAYVTDTVCASVCMGALCVENKKIPPSASGFVVVLLLRPAPVKNLAALRGRLVSTSGDACTHSSHAYAFLCTTDTDLRWSCVQSLCTKSSISNALGRIAGRRSLAAGELPRIGSQLSCVGVWANKQILQQQQHLAGSTTFNLFVFLPRCVAPFLQVHREVSLRMPPFLSKERE